MKKIMRVKFTRGLMVLALLAAVSCTTPADNTTGNFGGTAPNVSAEGNITSPSQNATRGATTVNLEAKNNLFDKTTITVEAGDTVKINLNNEDKGVAHNFAVYNDANATAPAIFQGQTVTGENKTTYTFTAPTTVGTYFFRCDTHPATMTGSLIVK